MQGEQTMARGRFISFEGVDGAGKSTQVAAVAGALRERGVDCVLTREPGGTPLGELLRSLVLGQDMAPLTETLLMFAARNEHVLQVIAPALDAGRWVLCDRYTDASYAYQGSGRGIAPERLDTLSEWVLAGRLPDLTVLVDVNPAEAQRRRQQARAADRFEQESAAFFERVQTGYLQRAGREPGRFLLVDGGSAADAVTHSIMHRLSAWLP
jgi:dTMP kinase